ncbi:MAG TPA: hypothetical protein VN282_23535 [Pyrinomonadaceae bacterium]|nr:hypothetical protein [Pyrinomonadaceae bacterium]
MKVKSKVKAGLDGVTMNHNQTVKGLRVKSKVKAGRDGVTVNHNQTVRGLRVRSSVKADGTNLNHSQKITRAA